jgi:integrase
MSDVRQVHVDAWIGYLNQSRIAGKTFNDKVILLRGVFASLSEQAATSKNPFNDIRRRPTETINKRPFEVADLEAIIAGAEEDKFIGPIVICALSTALRRGDCCLLKWGAVNLPAKHIALQPLKSKHRNHVRTVHIPIFPLFEKVLRAQEKMVIKTGKDDYVFPEQATMYRATPDGITWRIQKFLQGVGFSGNDDTEDSQKGIRGGVRVGRKGAQRKVSVRGAHSFRATWVTLALMAGVPMDVVRRVTGHATVEIVLDHYFSPGAASLRQELEKKLPAILRGEEGKKPVVDETKLLVSISDQTIRNQLGELIEGLRRELAVKGDSRNTDS